MEVFLYLAIPMALAGLVQYGLSLLWPKVPAADSSDTARDGRGKPAFKAASESDTVDGNHRLVREQARKEERVESPVMADEQEAFQLPSDFNMAEYRSHRE
jgi:hypothetical protein